MSPDNPAALAERGIPQAVEGAVDPSPTTIQCVRVDHRGLDVLVPQEEAGNPVEVGLFGTAAVMAAQGLHRAVV